MKKISIIITLLVFFTLLISPIDVYPSAANVDDSIDQHSIVGVWHPSTHDGDMTLDEDGTGHYQDEEDAYDVEWTYDEIKSTLTILYYGIVPVDFIVSKTPANVLSATSSDQSLVLEKEIAVPGPSTGMPDFLSNSNDSDSNWTCPSCGNTASGNFCNTCGAAKPERNEEITEEISKEEPKVITAEMIDAALQGTWQKAGGRFIYDNGEFTLSDNRNAISGTYSIDVSAKEIIGKIKVQNNVGTIRIPFSTEGNVLTIYNEAGEAFSKVGGMPEIRIE